MLNHVKRKKSFSNVLIVIVGYLQRERMVLLFLEIYLFYFFFPHSLDQCERVLELLKQYQNFKNVLTTLIQKEENVISLQASYMGKENLKKRIGEVSPDSKGNSIQWPQQLKRVL